MSSRRDFLKRGLTLAGAAGALASALAPRKAFARDAGWIRPARRPLRRFVHLRTQAVHVAGKCDPCRLGRAERRGLALRLARRTGYLSQRPEHRARCRQLRLAGIRAASRIVAHRRRARRRGRESDGRTELGRDRNAPQSRRRNETARLGVHGPRRHQQRESRRPEPGQGTRLDPGGAQDHRAVDRPAAARMARPEPDRDGTILSISWRKREWTIAATGTATTSRIR